MMLRDIYILYKKGELRCFFDKTTSEMLKRQEMCALFCFYHFVRVCFVFIICEALFYLRQTTDTDSLKLSKKKFEAQQIL